MGSGLTGSGSCLMVGFIISGVEPLGYIIKEVIRMFISLLTYSVIKF
jgi:hypothetical protein